MSAASLIRQRGQGVAVPMLERSGAKLAAGLRETLSRMASAEIEIVAGDVRDQQMGAWQAGGSVFAHFHFPMMKSLVLVRWSLPLLGWLVDSFYGGAGGTVLSRDTASAAELRLAERLSRQFEQHLANAWPDSAGAPRYVELGTGAIREDEAMAIQPLRVSGSNLTEQSIEIAYPVAALRGLPSEPLQAMPPASDPQWSEQLREALMGVGVPVRSVLARPEISVSRLLALQPGDTIPLHIAAQVPLTVGGRHFASGSMGEANGHAAIQIHTFAKGPHL